MDEIEQEAARVIKEAALKGSNSIMLVGLPIGTGQLPDQSQFVNSKCFNCKRPVQSTVVKEKILFMAELVQMPAKLLCVTCLEATFLDQFGRDS